MTHSLIRQAARCLAGVLLLVQHLIQNEEFGGP